MQLQPDATWNSTYYICGPYFRFLPQFYRDWSLVRNTYELLTRSNNQFQSYDSFNPFRKTLFVYSLLLFFSETIWLVKNYTWQFRNSSFKIGWWIRCARYICNYWNILITLLNSLLKYELNNVCQPCLFYSVHISFFARNNLIS